MTTDTQSDGFSYLGIEKNAPLGVVANISGKPYGCESFRRAVYRSYYDPYMPTTLILIVAHIVNISGKPGGVGSYRRPPVGLIVQPLYTTLCPSSIWSFSPEYWL